jgi:hypothetical protein
MEPSGFGSQNMNNMFRQQQAQPLPIQTSLTIDDIIGALQLSRDASREANRQMQAMKQQQQKPLDLNTNDTFYIICSRVFATGKVWQPVSIMMPESQMADYEMRRLQYTNQNVEYKVFKIKWSPDESSSESKNKQPISDQVDTDFDESDTEEK